MHGQTGRSFQTTYKEHKNDITGNQAKSRYIKHTLHTERQKMLRASRELIISLSVSTQCNRNVYTTQSTEISAALHLFLARNTKAQ